MTTTSKKTLSCCRANGRKYSYTQSITKEEGTSLLGKCLLHFRVVLFSNAELAENIIKLIFGSDLAGDLAKVV